VNAQPTKKSSLLKRIIKVGIILLVGFIILAGVAVLLLPSLISSDFGRRQVVSTVETSMNRPTSLENLTFSWQEGLALKNFTVTGQDQSPFLHVDSLTLDVTWPALMTGTVSIESLMIDGLAVTITRDEEGITSIDDLIAPKEPQEQKTEPAEKAEEKPFSLPAVFMDAHVKNSRMTFIDKRLNTTTEISNLAADITVESLTQPINMLVEADIAVDDKPTEHVTLSANALLAPKGEIDPLQARGALNLSAGFGTINADFDLSQLASDEKATGVSLTGRIDLQKMTQLAAGIVGLPPDFSMRGELRTDLQASGNLRSHVTVDGETKVQDLRISGGPFGETPFSEPQLLVTQKVTIDFSKESILIEPISLDSEIIALNLSGSVRSFQKNPDLQVTLDGKGDLYSLFRVAGTVAALPEDLTVKGGLSFSLNVQGPQDAVHLTGTTGVKQLVVEASFLGEKPFKEPHLEIQPDVIINIPNTTVAINALPVRSSIASLEASGSFAAPGEADMNVNASTQFDALYRSLSGMLPPTFPRQGSLAMTLTVKGNLDESISSKGDYAVKDVSLMVPPSEDDAQSSPVTLRLPNIDLHHDAGYRFQEDVLTVDSITGTSDLFNLKARATINKVTEEPQISSQVALEASLEKAMETFKELVPPELSAQGQAKMDFSLSGAVPAGQDVPLLSGWNGKGSFSTGTLAYEGVGTVADLQSTELALENGNVTVAISCSVNQGPLTLSATGDMAKEKPPFSLNLEGENIRLEQNITILGYIIPIFIAPAGDLSGTANVSVQSSWQGMSWEEEVAPSITGEGTLRILDGVLRSRGVLYKILQYFEEKETFAFEEVVTGFRMGDAKLYNDKITVNGEDLNFNLQGWTSLVFVPGKNGNPMEYTVSGDFIKKLGEDAQKALSTLGGGEPSIPIAIGGTVQNPKVTVKMPKIRNLLQNLLQPSRQEGEEGTTQPDRRPGLLDLIRPDEEDAGGS